MVVVIKSLTSIFLPTAIGVGFVFWLAMTKRKINILSCFRSRLVPEPIKTDLKHAVTFLVPLTFWQKNGKVSRWLADFQNKKFLAPSANPTFTYFPLRGSGSLLIQLVYWITLPSSHLYVWLTSSYFMPIHISDLRYILSSNDVKNIWMSLVAK